MFGEVMVSLADTAKCVSGDFHCMHLNIHGEEFDTIHKVMEKYYEQAADDYDTWAEWAAALEMALPNPNGAAQRIEWQSYESDTLDDMSSKAGIVSATKDVLEEYVKALVIVYGEVNNDSRAPLSIAIANAIQGRIEYWTKELYFFSKRRTA
jgi:DNA-binding ferritin-like protein